MVSVRGDGDCMWWWLAAVHGGGGNLCVAVVVFLYVYVHGGCGLQWTNVQRWTVEICKQPRKKKTRKENKQNVPTEGFDPISVYNVRKQNGGPQEGLLKTEIAANISGIGRKRVHSHH